MLKITIGKYKFELAFNNTKFIFQTYEYSSGVYGVFMGI